MIADGCYCQVTEEALEKLSLADYVKGKENFNGFLPCPDCMC